MSLMMTRWCEGRVWQADGVGAGAVETGGAGGADPAGSVAGVVADAGAASPPDAAAGSVWYDALPKSTQDVLVRQGWHKGDMADSLRQAAQGYDMASRKLGRDPKDLIAKPGESLDDWLAEHGSLLGVPERPEDYQIAKPAELPKGVEWDEELAKKAAALGHAAKIPPAQMGKMAEMFAGHLAEKMGVVERDLAQAKAEMTAALEKDWGAQKAERVQLATRAFDHIAGEAGIAPEHRQAVTRAMVDALAAGGVAGSAGDVALVKMFAAIGGLMAEDTLRALTQGGGGDPSPMTPQAARMRMDEIKAPGGAWAKAIELGDRTKQAALMDEVARLSQIIAPPKR